MLPFGTAVLRRSVAKRCGYQSYFDHVRRARDATRLYFSCHTQKSEGPVVRLARWDGDSDRLRFVLQIRQSSQKALMLRTVRVANISNHTKICYGTCEAYNFLITTTYLW